MTAAKDSRDYTDLYALLNALFSDSKSLKPLYPPIPLTPLKELRVLSTQCDRKLREDRKPCPERSKSEQLVSEYNASLHNLVSHMLTISLKHQSAKDTSSFGHMGVFWFNHEDTEDYIDSISREQKDDSPKPLLFEPDDYISMPCTKMFFTRVHRELWPEAFYAQKEGTCCIADYYIGACTTAHILEQLQTLTPEIEPEHAPYFLDETDEIAENQLLWRWARTFFQVDEPARYHVNLCDKDPQLLTLDVTGKDFPLLKRIIQWFYPLSESEDLSVPKNPTTLKNLMTYALLAYEGNPDPSEKDFVKALDDDLEDAPTLQDLHSASKALHAESPLVPLLEQLMYSSSARWENFQHDPDTYLHDFRSQVNDGIISILRESISN